MTLSDFKSRVLNSNKLERERIVCGANVMLYYIIGKTLATLQTMKLLFLVRIIKQKLYTNFFI